METIQIFVFIGIFLVLLAVLLVIRKLFLQKPEDRTYYARLICYHDGAWLCEYFEDREVRKGFVFMPEGEGWPEMLITVRLENVELVSCFVPCEDETEEPENV